ncbi:MAG: hypothetical protein K2M87_05080 [Muribaculaceae bacterium]|nr:hypothetical protein [Muribaculaceae bacterium]
MRNRFSLNLPVDHLSNAILAAMQIEVESRGHQAEIRDEVKRVIPEIARWLSDAGGKPGLLLMGRCGNGKTTMMRAVSEVIAKLTEYLWGYDERWSVPEHTAKSIAMLCLDQETRKDYRKLQDLKALCIDDLGEEPAEIIYYGMVFTPMIDLLAYRYDRQRLTIITTNLTPKEISEKYGTRIADRLREMMQPIIFTGESYRQ